MSPLQSNDTIFFILLVREILIFLLLEAHISLYPQPQNNVHQTLIIEEFEPDVFRQLIEYIHTGCVTLQPRTLLGESNSKGFVAILNPLVHNVH